MISERQNNIKSEGIIKLISDVKSAQGTRLDAFGMQAHYSVDSFSAAQFKTVAKKYAEAAGKVQLTELDSRQAQLTNQEQHQKRASIQRWHTVTNSFLMLQRT